MTFTKPPDSQAPPRPTEQSSPDKTLNTGNVLGQMTGFLRVGWGNGVYLRKGLRTGSFGTGAMMGETTDGFVGSDGANGGFFMSDRTNTGKIVGWYYTSGLARLWQSVVGDIWQVNDTTGQIGQAALSALSGNTNITVGIAGWQTPGTRLTKPDGLVYAILSFTATANITGPYQVLAMNAAHAPSSGFLPLAWRVGNVNISPGYIQAGGAIVFDGNIVNGQTYSALATYSQQQ